VWRGVWKRRARGVRARAPTVLTAAQSARERALRALWPKAALSRCAALALGISGSYACPAGFLPVNTAEACKSAAAIANRTYKWQASQASPLGCTWNSNTGLVYYTTDTTMLTGEANYFAFLLCAGAARSAHCGYTHVAAAGQCSDDARLV
jgi:hypothetical protein